MLVEPGRLLDLVTETIRITVNSVNMLGLVPIVTGIRTQSARKNQILGDCMTCTAIYGSGVRIGSTIVTLGRPPMVARGQP